MQKERKTNRRWNDETCYELARQCKSRTEFQKKSKGAYSAAKRNGWLKDYTWFEVRQKPSGYWDKEHCYEAAKECYSCVEFATKYGTAYQKALKHGWLKDYTWFERKHKPNGYWDKEHCYEAAKECKSVSGFRKQYNRAYYIARKNNWLQDYTWLYNK